MAFESTISFLTQLNTLQHVTHRETLFLQNLVLHLTITAKFGQIQHMHPGCKREVIQDISLHMGLEGQFQSLAVCLLRCCVVAIEKMNVP